MPSPVTAPIAPKPLKLSKNDLRFIAGGNTPTTRTTNSSTNNTTSEDDFTGDKSKKKGKVK